MGGRQSSQNNTPRSQDSTPADDNDSRYSVGSLDADTPLSGRAVLFAGPSANVELGASGGVVRRRRRRDRNDLFIETHSLPAHFFPALLTEVKCPVCSKRIATNEVESHLLVCLAKPKVSYNEDVLVAAAGECIICFEDMCKGDRIARLPCLCIYHKACLDEWFQRNRCCPEHPDQAPPEYMETLPRNPSRPGRPALSPRQPTNNMIVDNEIIDRPDTANSLPANLTSQHSPVHQLSTNTNNTPGTVFILPSELGGSGLQNIIETDSSSLQNELETDYFCPQNDSSGLQHILESDSSGLQNILEAGSSGLQNTVEELEVGCSGLQHTLEVGSSDIENRHPLSMDCNLCEDGSPSRTVENTDHGSPRTVVHVDEGSTHGTMSLFDQDHQLTELTITGKRLKIIMETEDTPIRNDMSDNDT